MMSWPSSWSRCKRFWLSKRITQKITQQQLAEQIGATRESVSRALTGLRDVQALRVDGRTLVVLNEKRLRRACSR